MKPTSLRQELPLRGSRAESEESPWRAAGLACLKDNGTALWEQDPPLPSSPVPDTQDSPCPRSSKDCKDPWGKTSNQWGEARTYWGRPLVPMGGGLYLLGAASGTN